MINAYYWLAKPGIVYGNALAAIAGFFFASATVIDWPLFLATLAGISLIMASACVFNNVYDSDIDARMERTKGRAIPAEKISPTHALIYGAVLGVLGIIALLFTNLLAFTVALIGFVVYVFLYTPLKHKNPIALFVGAVAGATPPVVGYTAVTGELNASAVFLFLALFLWQIPHFLAISVFRYDEYKAAGVPLYIKNPPSERAKKLARKIFRASIIVLAVFCVVLIFYP